MAYLEGINSSYVKKTNYREKKTDVTICLNRTCENR